MTTKPRRVTVTLSEEVAGAVDELAAKRECARSALVENALRWYLRVQDLAWDEASPEEIEAIERGRAEIGRWEFVTFEEIKRDLEADLLEQRTKRSDMTRLPLRDRVKSIERLTSLRSTPRGDVLPLRHHPTAFRSACRRLSDPFRSGARPAAR